MSEGLSEERLKLCEVKQEGLKTVAKMEAVSR